jgi:hypothetical protein
MAFGNGSTTVPSTRIVSSFGLAREHHLSGWKRASGLENFLKLLWGPWARETGKEPTEKNT